MIGDRMRPAFFGIGAIALIGAMFFGTGPSHAISQAERVLRNLERSLCRNPTIFRCKQKVRAGKKITAKKRPAKPKIEKPKTVAKSREPSADSASGSTPAA